MAQSTRIGDAVIMHSRNGKRETRNARQRGFTLIELMIVISIILILVSIAVPMYRTSLLRAREAVLKQDLFTLRLAIDQYTEDKQRGPQSLDDLVSAGYLKSIPKDPITNQADWEAVSDGSRMSIDQAEPGITDVRSSSSLISSEGTPYSSW